MSQPSAAIAQAGASDPPAEDAAVSDASPAAVAAGSGGMRRQPAVPSTRELVEVDMGRGKRRKSRSNR